MKVIFQPQRLLTLQTLLPRVCVPLFVFFFWLLCFLPEENNKNKLTVTKVSFISEWIISFLSSAPLFGFVVSIFSKWLMHCSKPFATSWDLSLVFRVRYIWRFIRVMHKRETLKCKRCFQLSKTLKNSFTVFSWKPFFMTKTMILTSRTKILSKHFRFESLNGIPQRVSSHLYIFSSKKCRHDINKLKFNRNTKFSNLSSEERSALKSLKKRIVIKAADRRDAVIVWRADLYQKKDLRQLSDTSFYAKIDKDLTLVNQNIVKNTINNLIAKQELPATAKNIIISTPLLFTQNPQT